MSDASVDGSTGGKGGPGDEDELAVSGQSVKAGVRVKFFSLSEGELNLDGYMQTSGGIFTGDVTHKKIIFILNYRVPTVS